MVDKMMGLIRLADVKQPEWIEPTADFRPTISRGPNHEAANPPPRTRKEHRWFEEHEAALKLAADTGKCPSCGEWFDPNFNNTLLDQGYQYGIECGHCR